MSSPPTESPAQSKMRPKYRQAADFLRRGIYEGRFPIGAKLPSVRQLSRELQFSLPTAFRAVQELAREGLVVSHSGPRGTVVVRDTPAERVKPTTLACLLRPHRPRNDADNFAVDMIQGVRDEISANQFRFVYHCLDEEDYEGRMVELAREEWVCGILMDQLTPLATVRRLAGMGLPASIMNRRTCVPNVSCATPDYKRLARESVRMFLNKGYERIGYCSLEAEESTWDESARERAYAVVCMRCALKAAAVARGLSEKDVVWFEEPEIGAPIESSPEFFGLPRRKPGDWRSLGVLANTDRRAVRLLEAIRRTDLVLGRDIGVIGCFDLLAGRRSPHPPSTWRINPIAVGAATVAQLISCIENAGAQASTVEIPVEFVDRGGF